MDFYIPEGHCVIEVDGQWYFQQGSQKLNASSQFREKILLQEEKGLTLVHVPYFEWDYLKDQEAQKNYLRHKLPTFLKKRERDS